MAMIERYFLQQNYKKIELERYLRKELDKAGFTMLEVVKTPLVTRIVLHVTRPGLAIGKGGQNIRQLTKDIEEKFGIQNPQIEIQEIGEVELDAKAMADKVKNLLERGFSWRSIAFKTVRSISEKGAQGIELILSGKLAGKGGRKKKQRIAMGYMKKVGDQVKLVDYAKADAYPKPGAIGIKLRIIRPGVLFPDKINVKKIIEQRKFEAEEKLAEHEAKTKEEAEKKIELKEEKPEAVEEKAEEKEKEKPKEKKEKAAKPREKKPESAEATETVKEKSAETKAAKESAPEGQKDKAEKPRHEKAGKSTAGEKKPKEQETGTEAGEQK